MAATAQAVSSYGGSHGGTSFGNAPLHGSLEGPSSPLPACVEDCLHFSLIDSGSVDDCEVTSSWLTGHTCLDDCSVEDLQLLDFVVDAYCRGGSVGSNGSLGYEFSYAAASFSSPSVQAPATAAPTLESFKPTSFPKLSDSANRPTFGPSSAPTEPPNLASATPTSLPTGVPTLPLTAAPSLPLLVVPPSEAPTSATPLSGGSYGGSFSPDLICVEDCGGFELVAVESELADGCEITSSWPESGCVSDCSSGELILLDFIIGEYCQEGSFDGSYGTSFAPTATPTLILLPTGAPTAVPSSAPTGLPSVSPTMAMAVPTADPSAFPSESPSELQTMAPTAASTLSPTSVPSDGPTYSPLPLLTESPSVVPSALPTASPSVLPTATPAPSTSVPTASPTHSPMPLTTESPSVLPSVLPTILPSALPTVPPSAAPTRPPSSPPTPAPTRDPLASAPTYEVVGVVSFSGITADEFNGDAGLKETLRVDLASLADVEEEAVSILSARGTISSGSRKLFQSESIEVDYTIHYSSQSTAEDAAAVLKGVEELPEVENYFASNGYIDVGYEVIAPTVLAEGTNVKGDPDGLSIGMSYGKSSRNVELRHSQKWPVPDNENALKFYENPQNMMMPSRTSSVTLKNASPVTGVGNHSFYDAV